MINVSSNELATNARKESHLNLALAAHYANLAQGHLEVADDPGALWTLQRFAEHARAALREFKAVQALMAAPPERLEAAE